MQNYHIKSFYTQEGAIALTGAGSDVETTLLTVTIPADAIGSRGYLKIKGWCTNTNGVDDKTIKVKFGTDVYVTKLVTAVDGFLFEAWIHNKAYAVQTGVDQAGTVTAGTANTKANVALTITGQLENTADTLTLAGTLVEYCYG